MAAPSDREKRMAALEKEHLLLRVRLELEKEHLASSRRREAQNEVELTDERARNADLTRELAEARGESRSQRHEIKALSRCIKGQLDARSLHYGADAPAPGEAAEGAAARAPPPRATDDCADRRPAASGGDTLETHTEYARARSEQPQEHARDGADLDEFHADDESALTTEPEVLPEVILYEIMDLSVEEEEYEIMDPVVDDEYEILDPAAEEEEPLGVQQPREKARRTSPTTPTPSPSEVLDWGTMDCVIDRFGALKPI
jgi:hypothetical protein